MMCTISMYVCIYMYEQVMEICPMCAYYIRRCSLYILHEPCPKLTLASPLMNLCMYVHSLNVMCH